MSFNVIKLLPNSYPKISELLINRLYIVVFICALAPLTWSQADQDFVLWQHAIGASGDDQLNGMVKDADDNIYVVGTVQSSEHASMNALVAKYSSGGTEIWSLTFGESGDDRAVAVEWIDASIYVLISTNSKSGQFSENNGREDIVMLQISLDGEVMGQTHFGGNYSDIPTDIAKTANGELLISAQSRSTSDYFDTNKGQADMWVLRITTAGETIWKKNLGGSDEDYSARVAELPNGEIVLLGHSSSYDGDVGLNYGDFDISLFKLSSTGSIIWEHNYGGYQNDLGIDLLIDEQAHIFVAGNTLSSSFDIGKNAGFSDAWVLEINHINGEILWEETHGGAESDHASYLSMDANNTIYLIGTTTASIFEGEQSLGSQNAWLAKVNAPNSIDHMALFGGNGFEAVQAFCMEKDGSILVIGSSTSTSGLISENHGNNDGWMIRFKLAPAVDAQIAVSLHPNPTAGIIYLNNLEESDVLTIVNAMGQIAVEPYAVSGFSEQVDLTALSSGVYLLHVARGTSTEVIRFVRN